jgi:SAM-dependent methyltransferase
MPRIPRAVVRSLLGLVGVAALWLLLARLLRRFVAFPVPAALGFALDSDFRRQFQPPGPILQRSGIAPGMRVLEVGCGSGAYTTYVARAVGEKGEVVALDIQARMLAQLERKLNRPEHGDIRNVRLHESDAIALPFDAASFDLAYLITALPEIPDQQRALREVWRVLKPGGILAVTEFLPDPDYPMPGTTVRRGQAAGFELEGVYGNLWTYTVRFRKRGRGGRGRVTSNE